MSFRLSFVRGWFLNQVVYLWVHHTWIFKRVVNLWMTWDGLHFLPNALHSLLKISWGINWNLLSLHHEKTTELLRDTYCIFISIQAIHMLGYTFVRGLACALQHSVSVPALLLLVYLPYWTLTRKREEHKKEAPVKHSALRVSTTELPNLDPSPASGHLWICERGHKFLFKQLLDVVSINSSCFSWQVIQKWVEV